MRLILITGIALVALWLTVTALRQHRLLATTSRHANASTYYQLFPLDDAKAEHTLSKGGGYYSLSYYKYGKAHTDIHTTDALSQLIGQTAIDLEPFVGQQVRVSGSGYLGSPLCYEACNRWSRPVLRIDSIEAVPQSSQ